MNRWVNNNTWLDLLADLLYQQRMGDGKLNVVPRGLMKARSIIGMVFFKGHHHFNFTYISTNIFSVTNVYITYYYSELCCTTPISYFGHRMMSITSMSCKYNLIATSVRKLGTCIYRSWIRFGTYIRDTGASWVCCFQLLERQV